MSRSTQASKTAGVARAALAGAILLMITWRQSAGPANCLALSVDGTAAAADRNATAKLWFEDARFGLHRLGRKLTAGQGRVRDERRQIADP